MRPSQVWIGSSSRRDRGVSRRWSRGCDWRQRLERMSPSRRPPARRPRSCELGPDGLLESRAWERGSPWAARTIKQGRSHAHEICRGARRPDHDRRARRCRLGARRRRQGEEAFEARPGPAYTGEGGREGLGHRHHRVEGRRERRRRAGDRSAGRLDPELGREPRLRAGARPDRQGRGRAALDGVEALDLDEIIPLEDPRPEGTAAADAADAARAQRRPNNNPYMPIGDTGAAQFMAAHPTWDGRGVTVGILDTGVDLDHPSLHDDEHGRAQDHRLGDLHRPVRPTTTRHGSTCRRRSAARLVHLRRRHATPAPGAARTASACSTSATRASAARSATTSTATATRPARSGIFAVLWDTAANKVWVDTNQNQNFADEPAMTDYKVRLRRRPLRHRQPGDAGPRGDAVRRPDRRQEQGRQHRHRLRRSTARTSPASRPATTCSAAR